MMANISDSHSILVGDEEGIIEKIRTLHKRIF